MNWLRNFLIGAILVVTFFLFIEWNEFKAKNSPSIEPEQTTLSSSLPDVSSIEDTAPTRAPAANSDDLPSLKTDDAIQVDTPKAQAELIHIKTGTLDLTIDTHGGDIVKSALLHHYAKINEADNPFVLLNRTDNHTYVAQSGLLGTNGTDGSGQRPIFTAEKSIYTLSEGDDTLVVDLTYQQAKATIIKRFTLARESYLINIEYIIKNNSNSPWSGAIYGQIRRDGYAPPTDTGIGMKPFLGAAITTNEKNYQKFTFGDLDDEKIKESKTGGWVAMVQHYFIGAWIPDAESTNNYTLRKLNSKNLYVLEYAGPVINIAANSTGSIKTSFYTGPKTIKALEKISPYLDLTTDYSFLWFIAKPLFFALDFIHSWVGNWGIAIMLLTLLIKIVFFYPSAMSYRSMAKMRKLTPMMTELKERYGDDKQKMSSELMKLYKKEQVNPLGGCLPILLQMPVFISLYWVIMESVELRHAPFFFWIHDLSIKDPYFVLPLIMGVTMFIQQKLNPAPPDPMQAKVMQMMPIFFTFLFMFFPAGLVLYWVVNNTLSISQQYVITKQIENAK